jgi:hypothetical protein
MKCSLFFASLLCFKSYAAGVGDEMAEETSPVSEAMVRRYAQRPLWFESLERTGTDHGETPANLFGGPADSANGIAVDSDGNAYIKGSTRSFTFPVTPDAFQTNKIALHDVIDTKLNPEGSVVYSTFLGGSGEAIPQGNFIGTDHINGRDEQSIYS